MSFQVLLYKPDWQTIRVCVVWNLLLVLSCCFGLLHKQINQVLWFAPSTSVHAASAAVLAFVLHCVLLQHDITTRRLAAGMPGSQISGSGGTATAAATAAGCSGGSGFGAAYTAQAHGQGPAGGCAVGAAAAHSSAAGSGGTGPGPAGDGSGGASQVQLLDMIGRGTFAR